MMKGVRYPPRLISYDGFLIYAAPCPSVHPSLLPWIKQFCAKPEHRWFAEVPLAYAQDTFNSYGIQDYLPNHALAREMMCDYHRPTWSALNDEQIQAVHDQAKHLYGLIHARWICTGDGLNTMRRKIFKARRFGICPRFHCKGMPLMPVGLSPVPKRHSVKLFCARCADIYFPPPDRQIDGAYFGPSFPSVFMIAFPHQDRRTKYIKGEQKLCGFPIRGNRLDSGPHGTNRHFEEDELDQEENNE
jgi:casein kinase II subunit beta